MRLTAALLGAVLWPAFVGAALGDAILFTLLDPDSVEWLGTHDAISRQGAYTIGFFVLWFLIVGACFASFFLHESATRKSGGGG